jgi:hypothetical protein
MNTKKFSAGQASSLTWIKDDGLEACPTLVQFAKSKSEQLMK